MFLKGHQNLPGLPNYLRFVVVCDILGSQKFCKYLKRVAIQKSLRTPALTPRGVKAFRKNCQGGSPILGFIAFLLTSVLKFTWVVLYLPSPLPPCVLLCFVRLYLFYLTLSNSAFVCLSNSSIFFFSIIAFCTCLSISVSLLSVCRTLSIRGLT
jgi:hypothetical protein